MVESSGGSSNGSRHNHAAHEHQSDSSDQPSPLYTRPQQGAQQAAPQPKQAGSTADAALLQQHQQQHLQPQPQQHHQHTAAASQASRLTPWHRQPRSNVVEIDDVQVTPIDDPFYDPTNPSSNYDKSSEEATAVARAALKEAAAGQHPPSNVVAIDEVDFEGFAAPLLEEAEAGVHCCCGS
jgi:hypothetical protein